MRDRMGVSVPDWTNMLRELFCDWRRTSDESDGRFTWLDGAALWWLKNEALWCPAKSGYRALHEPELRRMTIGQAVTLTRWGNKMRQAEYDNAKRAIEKAQSTARTRR